MKEVNSYQGKLRLDVYKEAIQNIKKETNRINSELENLGLERFNLKEIGSCSSLVSRTFGEPEILFSISKEKPPRGSSRFTHLEFINKLYLNGSQCKPHAKTLKDLFNNSNKNLLEFYNQNKII